jgi:putative PEP-CTERM system histidine kinase
MSLQLVGYGLAALAFGTLALLLRPRSRDLGAPEVRLCAAAAGMALWGACMAGPFRTREVFLCVDALHLAVWFWLLASIARRQGQPRLLVEALTWLVPAMTVAQLAYGRWQLPHGGFSLGVSAIPWTGLVASVLGLIGLEQVHRYSEGSNAAPVRLMCLAIGVIFAYDVFFYAQELMLRSLDPLVLALRGYVFAALVPVIAFAARRTVGWSFGLFVSRHVVFHSTSIVLVGGYLILTALVGEYVRATGGKWGPQFELAFLIAALLLLIPLVFAGTVRRRLEVLINKHFYAAKYDHRVEWLRFVRTIAASRSGESVAQTAIRSAAQILQSRAGALWSYEDGASSFVHVDNWSIDGRARSGFPGFAPDLPMVKFLRRTGWLIDLAEYAANPARYDHCPVLAPVAALDPHALIVPLLNGETLDGVLALERPAGLGSLTFEDRDLLKTVGRQIAAHLAQHDRDRRLVQSRQFEAYHRFTAFVMHDLKNMAAQLQLIVQNAGRHKRNPAFVDDAMSTISHSVELMQRLLSQLGQADTKGIEREVDLAEIAERAVLRSAAREPVPRIVISSRPRVVADAERLASVIEHVVRNAQDATPEEGEVVVEVGMAISGPVISVRDTGEGMDAAFIRDRLFRPFDTTKGARGMGIGAYQARDYMRSLGGEVSVESTVGSGTTFSLAFPAPIALRAAL